MKLLNEYIDAYLTTIKYLDDVVSEPAMEFGLSFEQYLIMHNVAHHHSGLTLTEIVESRNVTRAAISRQIKMLLRKQYIYQVPDRHDRRRMLLYLTPEGREVEQVVTERVQRRFEGWVESFGEESAKRGLRMLRLIEQKIVSKSRARIRARQLMM
ncbi:MarR family transcriptional regulator [Weissella muntiaci]|jgi:DNA-binding MarR family transcriptional regulator|uniref:MarR family transcriptional regulator n=1 Tax=Weissella muntiaci TaxID=2508881 RepID=A0A6C2C396_9LACO|nr:MarR family transcriptional regulator [Weissella muntiaci]TYC48450.1 MarR family transcriptional regulator [Weissella muntiaci]